MVWKNDQVSEKETEKILELATGALKIEGDFVELGCYKGDTSLMLAGLIVENSVEKSAKKLWIYDSFEGLPEKSRRDISALGMDFQAGVLSVTKREVKERFLRANMPVPMIKKGWFSELTEKDLPEKIAFAFLDGDLYESIRDSLKLVETKMITNGTIVIHDYNNPALPGVAKAVNEWLTGRRLKVAFFQSLAIVSML